jgi:DNA-binding HxlR family transcriptional regulator
MRRKSFGSARCPVARSLDMIGDWWTLLLVRDALRGARRFSEFQEKLGLAPNILTARLRKMVADGILETKPSPERSDRCEYHLTEKGKRLQVVLVALRQWGEDNLFEAGEAMTALVDKAHGKPVQRLGVIAASGQALRPEEIEVRIGTKDGG